MPAFAIKPLTASPQTLDALADILVETVAAGGSVHFLHPLALADARGFWAKAFAAAARGERIVLGAYDGETLISTVSLLLDTPPNQQHRAEIGKMMTHPQHRGRGAAKALLTEAERLAAERGRTLLNLDTAADDGAARPLREDGLRLRRRDSRLRLQAPRRPDGDEDLLEADRALTLPPLRGKVAGAARRMRGRAARRFLNRR